MKLSEINTTVWGIGVQGYGYVVTGLACIRQRIYLAISTTKGTDPLRPEFGSDVYLYTDKSIATAIFKIKQAIYEAVTLWIPEVTIRRIVHTIEDAGHLSFDIFYDVTDTDLKDFLKIGFSNGVLSNQSDQLLILQGLFPPNNTQYYYRAELSLNGLSVAPAFPKVGFANLQLLFAWVQQNWGYIGEFFLTADKILLYITDKKYSSGTLTIGLVQTVNIKAVMPILGTLEKFVLRFKPDSETDNLLADHPFVSSAELLNWVQQNWSIYGSWSIQENYGDFSGDFSPDFNTYSQVLILSTDSYPNGVITITKQ